MFRMCFKRFRNIFSSAESAVRVTNDSWLICANMNRCRPSNWWNAATNQKKVGNYLFIMWPQLMVGSTLALASTCDVILLWWVSAAVSGHWSLSRMFVAIAEYGRRTNSAGLSSRYTRCSGPCLPSWEIAFDNGQWMFEPGWTGNTPNYLHGINDGQGDRTELKFITGMAKSPID